MSKYYSFEVLPVEILFEFLKYLTLKELINLEKLNWDFLNLIRKTRWNHLIVRIRNIDTINFVINNYNFTKYNFSDFEADDNGNLLPNCHTFYRLQYNINIENVKLLDNCHILNLPCYYITDESVKLLGNCHTLNLSGCNEITDESVKLLTNCHILYLS